MVENVRRVVIGSPEPLKSAFTHVETLAPVTPEGSPVTQWAVWGWDELPQLPHTDPQSLPEMAPYPALGGMRISAMRFDGDPGDAVLEAIEAAGPLLPGFHHDAERPGMHHTDTFDFGVIVEGKVTIEADDGSTVTMGPGDVYICNGALHRWHYHADERLFIVFVALGAERTHDDRDSD
jgi:mannose-6-phosphate isomerase-like protein (cupin superfamily)